MCNTYNFYYTCGHTYLRTLISCPLAVDRATAAAIAPVSPRVYPLPLSPPPSPPSPYTSISSSASSDNRSIPTAASPPRQEPTPSLPEAYPASPSSRPPSPLTPSLRHLRTLSSCPTTPDAISIVPRSCTSCAALEAISGTLAGEPEGRATFGMVATWRRGEEMRGRERARSESGRLGMDGLEELGDGRRGRARARVVGVEDEELLRPLYLEGESGQSEGSEGSEDAGVISRGWTRGGSGSGESMSGSESRSERSAAASSALSGHSVTSSRRKGIDAKTRIASARKRIVSDFGPGW